MAAVTSAVVAAAAGVKTAVDSRRAAKKASQRASKANIESIKLLEEAGRKSEADILRGATEAAATTGLGAEEAEARIAPFAEGGRISFEKARDDILSGLPIQGPLASAIRQASTEFATSRPELFDLSEGPLRGEVGRQANLAVSGATPAFTESQLAAGQGGLSTAFDIGRIRQRGLEGLADIASTSAAQRASALVGSVPEVARQATGAQEAQLLGNVAGQRARTDITETLAQLAGEIS